MTDPRLQRLARTLVHYCVAVREGDRVALPSSASAAPLVREVYREVLRAGGHPYPMVSLDGLDEIFYAEASDAQLDHVNAFESLARGEFEALISMRGASNTRALGDVDPARQSRRARAYRAVQEASMARAASGAFRWTATLFPTAAHAQDAEMSLTAFEDFVFRATYSDADDPVAEWRAVSERQQRVVDWLAGKRDVVVQGPDVDMTLSIAGRTFINSDGRRNMPSGEVFTGPVEDSVNGWARFRYPAIHNGRSVEGVQLRFEGGRVVEATATKNQDYLLAMLDADEGARTLGEWAIGTNERIDRFVGNILFDEKIGGTIHMAIGAGYPETGSVNKSAVHWDMICDMRQGGRISVDGETIYDSGRFLIG